MFLNDYIYFKKRCYKVIQLIKSLSFQSLCKSGREDVLIFFRVLLGWLGVRGAETNRGGSEIAGAMRVLLRKKENGYEAGIGEDWGGG